MRFSLHPGYQLNSVFQLTPVEHILKRPDSYIGSVETRTEDMWVFNTSTSKLEFRYDFA